MEPEPHRSEAETSTSEELIARRTAIKRIATVAAGFFGVGAFLGCQSSGASYTNSYGDSYGDSYGNAYGDNYGYSSYSDYYSSINSYYSNDFRPVGRDGYRNFYASYDAYSSHDYR